MTTEHTTPETATYHHAGHIHRFNAPCGTVRLGAKVAKITGPASEAEMVALYGEECCSHCFPTAAAAKTAPAETAPAECKGTGTLSWDDVRGSSRKYRSPKGQCRACGKMVRLSSAGRMHKH